MPLPAGVFGPRCTMSTQMPPSLPVPSPLSLPASRQRTTVDRLLVRGTFFLFLTFLLTKNQGLKGHPIKVVGFMLASLLKEQKYILINWDTHQVLSGCSDDASTDLFVCKKNDTPAEID